MGGWLHRIGGLILAGCLLFNANAEAKTQRHDGVIYPVKVTGYCLTGITASGKQTRRGICAFRKEDIGKTACVYDKDRHVIGYYEVFDTGAKPVREGRVIDIWCATREECLQLTQMGYVEVYHAEG